MVAADFEDVYESFTSRLAVVTCSASFKYTHTHTRARTHMHAHTHTHTAYTDTCTRAHTCTHTHQHRGYRRARAHTYVRARTHSHLKLRRTKFWCNFNSVELAYIRHRHHSTENDRPWMKKADMCKLSWCSARCRIYGLTRKVRRLSVWWWLVEICLGRFYLLR